MADGTSEICTGTETCQVQPPGDGNVQLSSGPSRSCPDEREATDVETSREEAVPVPVSQKLTNESELKQSVTVPRPDFSFSLERRDHHHDIDFAGNEAIAMLESPVGGSPRAPSPHDQAKDRTRRVTYASFTASPPHSDKGIVRRDSSYYSSKDMESDGSEVDFATQAKQLRARERIVIRRQRVQRTRRLIRACREKVHKFRDELRDVVDLLARRYNERKTLEQQFEENIKDLYEKLQNARDKLGPAEDEYDNLERRLDNEEDDLEEEEEFFYSHNDLFNIIVPESRLDIPLSPLSEPSRPLDSDPEDFVFEHPLVRKYLKKLEEAEDLKEDMDQLENEYLEVSEKMMFRRKHHIPLSEETTTFLYDEYPKLHAEIIKDLRAAEDALFKIRDECIEEKLFTESDHTYERWDTLCDDLMDLVDVARDRSPIRAAAQHLDYNDRDTDFGDKKDYVNKWILQWIEESTVGTMLLQAWIYFEYPDGSKKNEKLGDEKWSALAVENWDYDNAGDAANKNNRDSKLDTIAGVNPAKTIRRHATSTGRSGVSSSLGTLDVQADIESDSAFHSTPQNSPEFLAPRRNVAYNEKMPSTGVSPKTISPCLAPEKDLEVLSEATPTGQEAITYTADELSVTLQSMSIDSTGEDTPSQSSYPYTESRSNSFSTTHHSDDDIQPFTTITASVPERHIDVEQQRSEYQDDLTDTPRRLPVDDRDVSIPYMNLFSSPEAIQDEMISKDNPPPRPQDLNPEPTEEIATAILLATTTSTPSASEPTLQNTHICSESFPNLKTTLNIQPNNSDISTLNTLNSPIPTITTTIPPPSSSSQSLPLPTPPTSRQRAKSESLTPVFSDRANSSLFPERERTSFLSSPQHQIRHRRSLSPTSFKFLSQTIRKIESFGSLRQGDFG
jgi:hypothetical protein